MALDHVLAHAALPVAVAAAAAFGAWRCSRLLGYARDTRLVKLMWFYALFAASLIAWAVWVGQLGGELGEAFGEMHAGNVTAAHGDVHARAADVERVDVFLVAHHVLMLASLGVGVTAFSHRRAGAPAVAALAFPFLAPFITVVLAVEAAMTLYIAVQAGLNYAERRTPGALQVAAGFLLFFLGHLSFFLFYHPAAARTPLGDVLALVGVVLLVRLLPRPST